MPDMKCNEPGCTEKPFFAVTQKQGARRVQPKTRYWCCTHAPNWVDRGYTSPFYDVKRVDQ
jgi:hypothetical protein